MQRSPLGGVGRVLHSGERHLVALGIYEYRIDEVGAVVREAIAGITDEYPQLFGMSDVALELLALGAGA